MQGLPDWEGFYIVLELSFEGIDHALQERNPLPSPWRAPPAWAAGGSTPDGYRGIADKGETV
jgi:hypothetical protein